MKVKVIKAKENNWYNKFIGKIFEVDKISDNDYKIIGSDKQWLKENDENVEDVVNWYIKLEDCEVIDKMQIGDKVRVIDSGYNYSIYPEWIRGKAPQYLYLYKNNDWLDSDKIYTVVAKGKHHRCNKDLVLIKDDNEVFLINEKGVEKVEFTKDVLETGLFVKTREYGMFLVMIDVLGCRPQLLNVKNGCYLPLDYYNSNLEYGGYTIDEIYKPYRPTDMYQSIQNKDFSELKLIWKRNEKKEELQIVVSDLKQKLADAEKELASL